MPNNGPGQYREALTAAPAASEDLFELGFTNRALAEEIEAAERAGKPGAATDAWRRLAEMTSADQALRIQTRSAVLLSTEDAAHDMYREAIERR